MVRKVLVTRNGFTNCPGCHAHIKVAAELGDTVCTFCDCSLKTVVPRADHQRFAGLARVVKAGRSGLLAASLLGLGGLAACDSTEPPKTDVTDVVADTAGETSNVALYGMPADTNVVADTAPDAGPQPEYGLPADTADEDTSNQAQPAYGIPADTMDGGNN
jgi:hypothetical protein